MNIQRVIFLAAAAAAALLAGCGRTPPASERNGGQQTTRASQRLVPAETDPTLVTEGGRNVLRDAAVQPAAFQTLVPVPKKEQQLATDALSRIGPPAVPLLVEALGSTDGQVRRQVCEVLMRMGPDAKEAVPDLVRLLEDDDEELRKMAAKALGRIGPDAGEAVPALMRTMLQGEPLPPPSSDR